MKIEMTRKEIETLNAVMGRTETLEFKNETDSVSSVIVEDDNVTLQVNEDFIIDILALPTIQLLVQEVMHTTEDCFKYPETREQLTPVLEKYGIRTK